MKTALTWSRARSTRSALGLQSRATHASARIRSLPLALLPRPCERRLRLASPLPSASTHNPPSSSDFHPTERAPSYLTWTRTRASRTPPTDLARAPTTTRPPRPFVKPGSPSHRSVRTAAGTPTAPPPCNAPPPHRTGRRHSRHPPPPRRHHDHGHDINHDNPTVPRAAAAARTTAPLRSASRRTPPPR